MELYYEVFELESPTTVHCQELFKTLYGTKIEEKHYIADQAFRDFHAKHGATNFTWPLGVRIFDLEGEAICECQAEIDWEPMFINLTDVEEKYDPELYKIPEADES